MVHAINITRYLEAACLPAVPSLPPSTLLSPLECICILLLRGCRQADPAAVVKKDTERAEASALLERRMAAMEAVLAARRTAVLPPAAPAAARGPGADLRFSVRPSPLCWLRDGDRTTSPRVRSMQCYECLHREWDPEYGCNKECGILFVSN